MSRRSKDSHKQDELAETQCPEPQPYDGNDTVLQAYDPYEYWEDLKYLSDGGFQEGGQFKPSKMKRMLSPAALDDTRTKKRKAVAQDGPKQSKRQRMKQNQTYKARTSRDQEEVVVWLSASDRDILLADPILKEGSSVPIIITGHHPLEQAPSSSGILKMDDRHDSAVVAEGFDLDSISSVAGLLSSEHIDTLKAILSAQGLDPEALDVVLKDLIEGREPEFEEEQEIAGARAHSEHGRGGTG